MSAAVAATIGWARASCWLTWLSFRRVYWSMQTFVALLILALLAAFVLIRGYFRPWEITPFSNLVLVNLYLGFVLPILCVCVGTQSLGGDWEDRSLVWLLTRPLPRPLIYLSKFVASLPGALALTVGGMALLGALAGSDGVRAFRYFWPAAAWGTITYLTLFHLLGAAFRRSTILGVVYAFVLETMVGVMPGLVKRASIGFYSKCLLYDFAQERGLDTLKGGRGIAPEPNSFFHPVPGDVALTALIAISVVMLVLGVVVFSRREYRDLT